MPLDRARGEWNKNSATAENRRRRSIWVSHRQTARAEDPGIPARTGRPDTHSGGRPNDEKTACGRGALGADGAGRDGADRRRVDGAVRRQLPDRAQERHGGLRQDARRRRPAGRGRAERRRQAARPDQQLRRLRRRRDHRQPGRHLGDPGDVGRGGGRRRAAGLRQPRADQRRHAARQPGLRRLGRARVRHARDQGDLPPVQGGRQDRGQRLRDHGRALEPGGAAAHPGHPRRDRLRRVRRDAQHHRQADLELDARRGAEPDDQLAVDRRAPSTG